MKRFRTVEEIWEHYFPPEPETGAEAGRQLAEKLLAEFRKALADKMNKVKKEAP